MNQKGSFLVLLLALVALGSIFIGASLRLIVNSQKLIATKARLDICAVRMATSRERFLREITATNDYVYSSLIATYVARGLMLFTLTGPAAAVGQRGAAAMNKFFAKSQQALITKQQIAEARLAFCEKTPFSEQKIVCKPSPALVATALKRNRALFPDLFHVYEWKQRSLGSVSCYLVDKAALRTKLELRGDRRLSRDEYSDAYKK